MREEGDERIHELSLARMVLRIMERIEWLGLIEVNKVEIQGSRLDHLEES
jgi:hypothetical protein